jgi:hypothetical protein
MRKLAVLLAAFLLLSGAAQAAKPVATKWYVNQYGFSIILPAKWYAVPRSVKAVQQTITEAKKEKKTALATEYGFYLTAQGKSQLKAFQFQAFLDVGPTSDPITPQLSIQMTPLGTKRPYKTSDLTTAADEYGGAIVSGNKGSKVAAPKRISLPEGPAELVEGTIPEGSGLSDGFALYLMIHKGKLYVFKFDIDATVLAQATVFRSIAENVRWL